MNAPNIIGKVNTIVTIVASIVLFSGLFVWRLTVEDSQKPSIVVTWPIAGETWKEGASKVVAWVPEHIPDNYKISVSIRRIPPPPLHSEGQEFDPLVVTGLPFDSTAVWHIPDMYPAGNYVLTVTAYQSLPITNPISGESQVFKIEK